MGTEMALATEVLTQMEHSPDLPAEWRHPSPHSNARTRSTFSTPGSKTPRPLDRTRRMSSILH